MRKGDKDEMEGHMRMTKKDVVMQKVVFETDVLNSTFI